MNTNEVLNWVKNFKYSWLPVHLQNNTQLIGLISDKLYELEQLLDTNHEYHINSPLVFTSLDNHQTMQDENELFSYPAIRIKRISLAEAKRFLPPGWDTPKTQARRKRGRKKPSLTFTSRKRKRNLPSQTYDEIILPLNDTPQCSMRNKPLLSTHSIEIPSVNENKPKQKRKLRAIDGEDDDLYTLGNLSQAETSIDECEQISRYIGQNGILSQTRKTNETTITTFDETYNSTMKSFCNIFPTTTTTTTTNEDLSIADEPSMIINNNSILNYDVCVEDITNDGFDEPSSNQLSFTT